MQTERKDEKCLHAGNKSIENRRSERRKDLQYGRAKNEYTKRKKLHNNKKFNSSTYTKTESSLFNKSLLLLLMNEIGNAAVIPVFVLQLLSSTIYFWMENGWWPFSAFSQLTDESNTVSILLHLLLVSSYLNTMSPKLFSLLNTILRKIWVQERISSKKVLHGYCYQPNLGVRPLPK